MKRDQLQAKVELVKSAAITRICLMARGWSNSRELLSFHRMVDSAAQWEGLGVEGRLYRFVVRIPVVLNRPRTGYLFYLHGNAPGDETWSKHRCNPIWHLHDSKPVEVSYVTPKEKSYQVL